MSNYFIGIDGGGTKTAGRLALIEKDISVAGELPQGTDFQTLAEKTVGPCNPHSNSSELVAARLSEVIDGLCDQASIAPEKVQAVCLGSAGCDRPREKQLITPMLRSALPNATIRITNDAITALAGGLGKLDGIMVIAGTGSIALGARGAERTERAGGWGHLLGDEGSGFMLARDALKSICRAHDGRAPETRLTDAILKELLLETPTELIGWMTQLQGDKSREAALSRVVLQVAEEGDATAHAICKHHAGELALMAETVRKKLFSDYDEVEILPGGGNLEGNAYYRELFTSALAEFSPAFKPQESRGGAAIGALILSAIEYQKKGAYHPTQAWAAIDPDKLGAE